MKKKSWHQKWQRQQQPNKLLHCAKEPQISVWGFFYFRRFYLGYDNAMEKDQIDKDYDAIIPAPFGAIGIRAQDDFLTKITLIAGKLAEKQSSQPFVQEIAKQIKQYLIDPTSPLDMPYAVKGTPYQKRVWRAISAIPAGQTLSYGELADKVSSGSRAVANVCGANQVPLFIPCHRVVAKNGLGGFMQGKENGLAVKQWLLDHEQAVSHPGSK
ncbi:MAG: methylated-DNA--[protein]-cysteine S-methyltransferase [Methylophilaceae bacterium]